MNFKYPTTAELPQQNYKAKINNNPIDLVLDIYNQIMECHPYQIQIHLSSYLEKEGCFGKFDYYHQTIEITSTRNILFTAQILAHELAHVLDFRDKGFLNNYFISSYNPLPHNFNDHDENWERWLDLLSHPIKMLFSHIQVEVHIQGPEFTEPPKAMREIDISDFHKGDIDLPKNFDITFPEEE